MKIDVFGRDIYYTAESAADLDGWELIQVERFKPKVFRITQRRRTPGGGAEMRQVYCHPMFLTFARELQLTEWWTAGHEIRFP